MMDRLAVSMTNDICNKAGPYGALVANGTTLGQQVVVEVAWGWLALPAAAVAMSALFVLVTITQNNLLSCPVWKSSTLAEMYHGLIYPSQDLLEGLSEIEHDARQRGVRLERSANGALRLVEI